MWPENSWVRKSNLQPCDGVEKTARGCWHGGIHTASTSWWKRFSDSDCDHCFNCDSRTRSNGSRVPVLTVNWQHKADGIGCLPLQCLNHRHTVNYGTWTYQKGMAWDFPLTQPHTGDPSLLMRTLHCHPVKTKDRDVSLEDQLLAVMV